MSEPPARRAPLIGPGVFAAAGGAALFVAVLRSQGVGAVVAALAVAGPALLPIAAFHAVPLLANALGWRRLLPPAAPVGLGALVHARWISESVNGLLPVAQIGGNVVRATLLARRGVAGGAAGASVVLDVTLNVVAQIVFTLLGLGLLLSTAGARLAGPVLLGTAIMAAALLGFVLAQRRDVFAGGARLLRAVTGRLGQRDLGRDAAAIDAAVRALYGRRAALVGATTWHLASWIAGAGEVWLGLYCLGHGVDVVTALLIESLGQALRSAAFFVPGALGVQEGGYLLLGGAFGIAPETALALSLVKRSRELLLGLPGLAVWLFEEAAVRNAAVGSVGVGER
ncbi:flippase-like domain-containing protein [bacterium]|nr:flippase-like domain-containing protein [bacterium]